VSVKEMLFLLCDWRQVLRFFLTGDKHFNALTFDTTTEASSPPDFDRNLGLQTRAMQT
jgi:hypothetical protein